MWTIYFYNLVATTIAASCKVRSTECHILPVMWTKFCNRCFGSFLAHTPKIPKQITIHEEPLNFVMKIGSLKKGAEFIVVIWGIWITSFCYSCCCRANSHREFKCLKRRYMEFHAHLYIVYTWECSLQFEKNLSHNRLLTCRSSLTFLQITVCQSPRAWLRKCWCSCVK